MANDNSPVGQFTIKDLFKNPVLAVIIFLLGGGTTASIVGVARPSENSGNSEILESIRGLAIVVSKLSTDPTARPEAYTREDGKRDVKQSEAGDKAVRDRSDDHHYDQQRQIDQVVSNLSECFKNQQNHQVEASKYIRDIELRGPIIQDNQDKAHKH